jgi:hypothetical protein
MADPCFVCGGKNQMHANYCSNVNTAREEQGSCEPPAEPIMQFFDYRHLPIHLADVSRPFAELAQQVVISLPRNPERSVALRKLLEAKDCAVRALLFK